MKIEDKKTFLVSLAIFFCLGLINVTLTVGSAKATQRVKNYLDSNDYQLKNYYVNTVENIRTVKIKPPIIR